MVRQWIDTALRRWYGEIFLAYWLAWGIAFVLAVRGLPPAQLATALLAGVFGGLAILEVLLRAVMAGVYGRGYEYSVLNFSLVDHPVYGNCFRRSVKMHEVDHLLFDKFLFRHGAPRHLDAVANLHDRVRFSVNSLGYRGKEFTPRKQARMRVFCVGGSTTACDCNADEEAWPARLQDALRGAGLDVEVINAGVQGWYSYQDLLRVREEIAALDADVILLQQGWNEEFEFSSLSLGRRWAPQLVRNVREQHHLCCPPRPVLSSPLLLSVYMAVHAYLKRMVFLRNMSFDNPGRWRSLQSSRYLIAWFDNMISTAAIARDRGILFYNVNLPSLLCADDADEVRALYVAGTRLTPAFAKYQAISKARISRTLRLAAECVPCLDLEADIDAVRGQQRLAWFDDEMHTSVVGSRTMAERLARHLLEDGAFRCRHAEPRTRRPNVSLDRERVARVRAALSEGDAAMDAAVDVEISRLARIRSVTGDASVISEAMERTRQ